MANAVTKPYQTLLTMQKRYASAGSAMLLGNYRRSLSLEDFLFIKYARKQLTGFSTKCYKSLHSDRIGET